MYSGFFVDVQGQENITQQVLSIGQSNLVVWRSPLYNLDKEYGGSLFDYITAVEHNLNLIHHQKLDAYLIKINSKTDLDQLGKLLTNFYKEYGVHTVSNITFTMQAKDIVQKLLSAKKNVFFLVTAESVIKTPFAAFKVVYDMMQDPEGPAQQLYYVEITPSSFGEPDLTVCNPFVFDYDLYKFITLDTPNRNLQTFKSFLLQDPREEIIFVLPYSFEIFMEELVEQFIEYNRQDIATQEAPVITASIAKTFSAEITRKPLELKDIVEEALESKFTEIKFRPLHNATRPPAQVQVLLTDGTIYKESKYSPMDISDFKRIVHELISAVELEAAVLNELPQDFSVTVAGTDLRVATIPVGRRKIINLHSRNIFSVAITLRIRKNYKKLHYIHELGHPPSVYSRVINVLLPNVHNPRPPGGAIYIAGEMNSGKSTFLMSFFRTLHRKGVKDIFTSEDPIEEVESVFTQYEINMKGNKVEEREKSRKESAYAFTSAVLRHNPAIIGVGEIRERNMLSAFIQDALSGKPTIATIHAPNLVSIFDKLKELGATNDEILNVTRAFMFLSLMPKVKPQYLKKKPLFDENGNINMETIKWLRQHIQHVGEVSGLPPKMVQDIMNTYIGPYMIHLLWANLFAELAKLYQANKKTDKITANWALKMYNHLGDNPYIYYLDESATKHQLTDIVIPGEKVQVGSFWFLTQYDRELLHKALQNGIDHSKIRMVARSSGSFVSLDECVGWAVLVGWVPIEHAISKIVQHDELYPAQPGVAEKLFETKASMIVDRYRKFKEKRRVVEGA